MPALEQISIDPMDDLDENASMVNPLQRQSSVVVQKSLAEGFGLTVAEAMWKGRAVVASRTGGIRDQIVHGKSGLLLSDPQDGREFGSALAELVHNVERVRQIGVEAHASVREHFLGPHHLGRYFEVISRLLAARAHETGRGEASAGAAAPTGRRHRRVSPRLRVRLIRAMTQLRSSPQRVCGRCPMSHRRRSATLGQ